MNRPQLLLTRDEQAEYTTFGRLELPGPMYKIFVTLEPLPAVVPVGVYPLVYEFSPKFKRELWELKDVPNHSEIKIHNGNTWSSTEGCVVLGLRKGLLNNVPAVLSSRLALSQFHEAMRPYERAGALIEVIDLVSE